MSFSFIKNKKRCLTLALSLCMFGSGFSFTGVSALEAEAKNASSATSQIVVATSQAAGTSASQAAGTSASQAAGTSASQAAEATSQAGAASSQAAETATKAAEATSQAAGAATSQAADKTTEKPDQTSGASKTVNTKSGTVKAEEKKLSKKETALQSTGLTEKDITYRILLDPGHGGVDTGADGINSSEKRLNLIIGQYLKKELEKYENVKVGLTRKKDVYVELHDRVKKGVKKKVDLIVSLHHDSWDVGLPYANGSTVLVAKMGSYRKEMCIQEERLARSILSELEDVGLVNRGMVRKKSTEVPKYEDGSLGDYHAIIRDGMRAGIPAILVEHAFCDSEDDYYSFLNTKKKLKKLAQADARGIARYLQLRKKDSGEILPAVTVEGKKQQCTADKDAYYTLAVKRYNNKIYYEALDNAPAVQEQKEEGTRLSPEEEKIKQEEAAAAKAAQAHASDIEKRNKEGRAQAPTVILICLGLFAVAVFIKEFDFGFEINIRIKKRNDRYDPWKNANIKYHMG